MASCTASADAGAGTDTVRTMITVGQPAPEFTLPDHTGSPVSLADHLGHRVLLWWYPKASTPG
jgi:peroxiredoxin Q/BCP